MTITNTGDYIGILSLSFNGSNTKSYQFRLYNVTQTSQVGWSQSITGNGANEYVNVILPFYFENTAGDEYIFQVQNVSGNEDIILQSGNFWVCYLHE